MTSRLITINLPAALALIDWLRFGTELHACDPLLPGGTGLVAVCTVCGKLMPLPVNRCGGLDPEAELAYAEERQT